MTPGPTALTRMPYGPHSQAATSTNMLSAAFDAQYTPIERSISRALTLDVATIEPGTPASIIARANARITSKGPRVFTAMTRSHSSTGRSRSMPECPTPAVTVTSDATPTRATVSSSAASTDAGSVTSHFTSYAPAMSHTTTSLPRSCSASTTAAPIPEAPPTTTCARTCSAMGRCYTSVVRCNSGGTQVALSTVSPT